MTNRAPVSAPTAGERQSETISEFTAFAAVMRAEVDPHASDDSIKFAWNMGFGKLWRGARSAGDAVPAGFKLVPIEPTPAMIAANGTCDVPEGAQMLADDARTTWAAMLGAAPAPGNTEKPTESQKGENA